MPRHGVEAIGEIAQIAPPRLHRHLHVEIAIRHPARGDHQVADRVDEAVGEGDADPQGGQQQHQGKAQIHDGEGDLEHQPVRLVLAVLGDVVVGEPHELEHFGVHRASHEQVDVLVSPKFDDRADKLGIAG